eukprot:15349489-Ditylum_brightwellii.AAC.1
MSVFDCNNDVFNLNERQITFEEYHSAVLHQDHQAYTTLKGAFSSLCKLINGDVDLISEWEKNVEGIGLATAKLNVSPNNSSEVSGEYVSCYKGPGSLKERGIKWLKTKDYR